jgi:hypothetical protein
MDSTKVETTENPALNKADVISWPDSVRLKMIEKSEFYAEPRIYQYGYYDGYQKRNDQIKKAIEIIQKVRGGCLNPDAMLQNVILELLK